MDACVCCVSKRTKENQTQQIAAVNEREKQNLIKAASSVERTLAPLCAIRGYCHAPE